MPETIEILIVVSDELAQQLPTEPVERRRVLELGLKEWRVRRALEAFQQGEGTLAYAAKQAGVPLREMIPLAYAHGLTPRVDPAWRIDKPLALDRAAWL